MANQYIASTEPWKKIKVAGEEEHVHKICTTALNAFKIIMTYLSPIMPVTANKTADFLQTDLTKWQTIDNILVSHKIKKYAHLLKRIEIN